MKDEPQLEQEPLTFPQRRADALLAMAEGFSCLDAKDNGLDFKGLSLKGHERCQLVLHVNSDSNSDSNLDGRWLLPDAARRLACDALLNGENLNANDLKQALPKNIYDGIDENTAVTKWIGELIITVWRA